MEPQLVTLNHTPLPYALVGFYIIFFFNASTEPHIRQNFDMTVTMCRDFIRTGCQRERCRYFHPPPHIMAQVERIMSLQAIGPPQVSLLALSSLSSLTLTLTLTLTYTPSLTHTHTLECVLHSSVYGSVVIIVLFMSYTQGSVCLHSEVSQCRGLG